VIAIMAIMAIKLGKIRKQPQMNWMDADERWDKKCLHPLDLRPSSSSVVEFQLTQRRFFLA
jgi:hypothetical protein